MKIIVVALLFLAGLIFAQDNKLLFKGVSLNDNPQTVLSNLQKVGFKIISSKDNPGGKYYSAFTSVELVGPYFKWNNCKIKLEIEKGKVMRLDVHDSGDELFNALVTKYGMPQRGRYNILKWTGFVDGEIWRRPGDDFDPLVSITFFTIHKFRLDQQEEQQKKEQNRKWAENL